MAQAQSPRIEPEPVQTDEGRGGPTRETFDVREEQIAHTKRVLDLQIEGSRHLYDDALRILLVEILVLGALLAGGLVAVGFGGLAIGTVDEVSIVLVTFGTGAVFVSMAGAAKAYLGDVANYGTTVRSDDGEDYPEKFLSRNIEVIKGNARDMEERVDTVRTSLFTLVGGLGGLFLGVGFQVLGLAIWAEVAISIGALLALGYLVGDVMGVDDLGAGAGRFLR